MPQDCRRRLPFRARLALAALIALLSSALPARAQTVNAPPAQPDDPPSIKVGVTLFADYTVQQTPKIQDADGNQVTLSAFQIGRSYINVTGNVTRTISFRVTPDITRETGVGSSLNGSYSFRLKYAYAQWNLDGHVTPGSFARFGMQQNPYFDYIEAVYRYRFQGTIFAEREGPSTTGIGYLSSADVGAVFRYSLPGDYGDIQGGAFNGENFNRAEVNDQKAFMLRGTLRPLPGHAVLRGLRVTGFVDKDAYVKNADRTRAFVTASFEHAYVNAAFEYLQTKDQTSATRSAIDGKGWSLFVTPKTARGWEGLLRFDHMVPNQAVKSQTRDRTIAGIAYWFRNQGPLSTALMFDVDNARFEGFSPAQPTQRRLALHALVNF